MVDLKVFAKAQGKYIRSFSMLEKVRGLKKKRMKREWDIER
jgi:hypothetical protein